MANPERLRDEAALGWVRRLHDPTFADWGAHLAWLEADVGHAAAFDRMLLLIDDETAELASTPPAEEPLAANDNTPARRWRWSVAAAAVGALGLAIVPSLRPAAPLVLRTDPGEHRETRLNDGTQVALNGASEVRMTDARTANITRGEAFFTVAHDDRHAFRVTAGDVTLEDVGTAFDVVRRNGAVDVAVREGAVRYDPGGVAMLVPAGRSLRIARGTAVAGLADAATIGGWRHGKLVFRDETLDRVAEDLGRTTGVRVSVSPTAARRRFTGVVMIDTDRVLMLRRLAAVTGTRATRVGTGWRLLSSDR